MAAKPEYPLLAVRPREDKSGWYVEAWWTNRPSENIGHFATQSEARNWITLESTPYFVLREIDSMIKHPNNRQADQADSSEVKLPRCHRMERSAV
jgi:hypothetical protein